MNSAHPVLTAHDSALMHRAPTLQDVPFNIPAAWHRHGALSPLVFAKAARKELNHRVDDVLHLRDKTDVPCKHVRERLLRALMLTRTKVYQAVPNLHCVRMIQARPVSANID